MSLYAHLAPNHLAEFAERLLRPRAVGGTNLAHDEGGLACCLPPGQIWGGAHTGRPDYCIRLDGNRMCTPGLNAAVHGETA